jgi:hypothetical protein
MTLRGRKIMKASYAAMAVAVLTLGLSAAAAAATGEDWPCDQVLQPQLSVGAMWEGPDPTAALASWDKDGTVRAMVERVAPRRVPLDEAKAEIHRFALGITGDRKKTLTEVFAGIFDTINHDRSSIIHGIKRYHGRQAALAKDIEDKTAVLDGLDPASSDQAVQGKRQDLQNQLNWETRIFDDRQRLLPAVCEQPVLLEQRLYQLSHAIMADMNP